MASTGSSSSAAGGEGELGRGFSVIIGFGLLEFGLLGLGRLSSDAGLAHPGWTAPPANPSRPMPTAVGLRRAVAR